MALKGTVERRLAVFPLRATRPCDSSGQKMPIFSLVRRRLQAWRDRKRMIAASPSLLGIPPELRLMILAYVLVPWRINLTGHYKPPGVLGTCRSIRNEAQEMYYLDHRHHFAFALQDCDARLVLRYEKVFWRQLSIVRESHVGFHFRGNPSWENLLDWCRVIHARKGKKSSGCLVPSYSNAVGNTKISSVVVSALEISIASAKKERWSKCEETLESLHDVAEILDFGWL